jgi:nitroreductase
MNECYESLLNRRSVRKYKAEMPPKEEIEKIIQAGLYAASGHAMQSSVVIAITNRELRDRLMEMNRVIGGWKEGFDPFYGAPAVLLVLADRQSPNHVYDGALSMGNMMLAAHGLGLGSCWINRARQEFDTEEGKEILRAIGVEGDYEGIGHCIVGYPEGDAPEAKPRKENRVFWVE